MGYNVFKNEGLWQQYEEITESKTLKYRHLIIIAFPLFENFSLATN